MNTEALFLFLILLLGLVLCSFLGGKCYKDGFTGNFSGTFQSNNDTTSSSNSSSNNSSNKMVYSNGASTSSGNTYDNYNHFNGSSTQLANGTTFYGPDGGTLLVSTGSNGEQTLQVTLPNSNTVTFTPHPPVSSSKESYTNYSGNNGTATTFYGPDGDTATVVQGDNGQQAINIQTSTGSYTYTPSGSYSNTNTTSSTQYYGSTGYPMQESDNLAYEGQSNYQGSYNSSSAGLITGPNGGSAGAVTGPNGNTAYYAQGPQGNTVAGTTNTYPYSNQYYGPNGGSAGAVTGPNGNTAYYAQGPYGNTVAGTTSDYHPYYSALPPGIPRSQIPPGQEDLYILKSEVIPPVCPACPTSSACPREEKCPPCPACARCPEPSFECKKVPNYNAIDEDYLPTPILNDFSQFGM